MATFTRAPSCIQSLAHGLALLLCTPLVHAGTADRTPSEHGRGWAPSFLAGSADPSAPKSIRGTEIVHLVAHRGRLFAGNGYWMDPRGPDRTPWYQVLVLAAPEAAWKVGLAGGGRALTPPVALLLAASDSGQTSTVWTRDDARETWVRTTLQTGGQHRRSTRAFAVHRDRETGIDRLFVAAGSLGVYSGVYDADLPGKIRWAPMPELGPLTIRPMAFAEANGRIYASAGASVYRRTDGAVPTWSKVYSDQTPEHWELGGIRGLTALPSPDGTGQSLLFSHTDRIIRIDPKDHHRATVELAVRPLLEASWGTPFRGSIIAAYSNMLPLEDPATGRTVHILGVQGRIERGGRDNTYRPDTFFGWYAGGAYLIRASDRSYRLQEVNGTWAPGKPKLVAPRAFAVSPFPQEAGGTVYFGGFDANFFPALDTAWIFRAPVEAVLDARP